MMLTSAQLRIGLGFNRYKNPVYLARTFSSIDSFLEAQEKLKVLKSDLGFDIKVKLYALFKQTKHGDVSTNRPSALDFAGRTKYDAWKNISGTSQDSAKQQYVHLVNSLFPSTEVNKKASNAVSELKTVPGLDISIEGKLFLIQLNRPDKLNAITWEMYNGITEALKYSSDDLSTSLTVLKASGKYFCSGNDLSNFMKIDGPEDIPALAQEGGRVLSNFTNEFINHKKPLIALVNGPAVGISVTVLPLCDLVLASDSATFITPFTALGQSPEGCSSHTFPLLMGTLKASEFLLFGRKLTAEEAFKCNIVNEIIPERLFHDESQKRVESYANLPPESLRLNKQLLRDAHLEALLKCNRRENELLKKRWQSEECMNSLQQFMNRKL